MGTKQDIRTKDCNLMYTYVHVFIPDSDKNLSSDVIVSLPSSRCTVDAQLTAETGVTPAVFNPKQTGSFQRARWLERG